MALAQAWFPAAFFDMEWARRWVHIMIESDEPAERGMPRWRARQRELPPAEKFRRVGQFIQETRRLEKAKRQWKESATSSNNSSRKEH